MGVDRLIQDLKEKEGNPNKKKSQVGFDCPVASEDIDIKVNRQAVSSNYSLNSDKLEHSRTVVKSNNHKQKSPDSNKALRISKTNKVKDLLGLK